jgi:hypothetical protein
MFASPLTVGRCDDFLGVTRCLGQSVFARNLLPVTLFGKSIKSFMVLPLRPIKVGGTYANIL